MLPMQKFLIHAVDSMLNLALAYRLNRQTSPTPSLESGPKEVSQVTDSHVIQPPHHAFVSMEQPFSQG